MIGKARKSSEELEIEEMFNGNWNLASSKLFYLALAINHRANECNLNSRVIRSRVEVGDLNERRLSQLS
jgi:hypothetical protein